jgi:hypothetical protein
LTSKFPFYTPYQFAGNKPIWAVDLDGLEDVIFQKALNNNNAFKTALNVVSKTTIGQQFDKVRLSQNKYDVYYYQFELGIATGMSFSVNNRDEYNKTKYSVDQFSGKKSVTDFDLYFVEDKDLQKTFDAGKGVVFIGIDKSRLSGTDKESLIGAAETIHHEEGSHGFSRLLGKKTTLYQEHEDFQNDNSSLSPSVNDLRTNTRYKGTKAEKGLREIEKIVNDEKSK